MTNKRRDCGSVIKSMIELVPKDKTDFIRDLEWNMRDASYKAPEETIQWERTAETLAKHMVNKPTKDWEIKLCAIWSNITVEEAKKMIEECDWDES